MSTETQQMLAALSQVHDDYHGKIAAINTSVQGALAAVPENRKYFYVDQSGGNDANDGTNDHPMASIQAAFDRTPAAGICVIVLKDNYYMAQTVQPKGLAVEIVGQNKPKLTFSWETGADGKKDRLASFWPRHHAPFLFRNMEIEFPADPPAGFNYTHMNGLVCGDSSNQQAIQAAKFVNFDFINPSGATACSLFGQLSALVVAQFLNCVFPPDWEGRIRKGVGGAGVDPNTFVRAVSTNLSWV